VHSTEQQDTQLKLGSVFITPTTVTSDLLNLIPVTPFPPSDDVRHDSVEEIPSYKTSTDIIMFRETFQEFLS